MSYINSRRVFGDLQSKYVALDKEFLGLKAVMQQKDQELLKTTQTLSETKQTLAETRTQSYRNYNTPLEQGVA